MEIGAERIVLQSDIGIVVDNEVADGNASARGEIITVETGEINELTTQECCGNNEMQAEKRHPRNLFRRG